MLRTELSRPLVISSALSMQGWRRRCQASIQLPHILTAVRAPIWFLDCSRDATSPILSLCLFNVAQALMMIVTKSRLL